jgi:tRNA-dihydrouridine synthase
MKELDRRISVAPMMDWTDCAKTFFSIKCLRPVENACLLYVSSILRKRESPNAQRNLKIGARGY